MSIQGISCPKCGSRRISIVAAETLTFKCLDCGYVWSPNLPAQGLVSTRAGEVHWTEIKKVMEDAMSYVHELLDSDTDCNGVISRVQERFGNYLTTRDVIKVVINGVRKYLDEVRYKDVNKYSRLAAEFMKCKELYSK
jgi:rubredoxin